MLFSEFLADIKGSMQQYDSAGLIDEISIYDWMIEGLNELSIIPTVRIEAILEVKNGKVKLPSGFKTLVSALKCEPLKMTVEEPEDTLIDVHYYRVRETVTKGWNVCNPCDIEEKDSCVVEKLYLHNGLKANKYYSVNGPIKLNLTPYTKKVKCDSRCLNFGVESPFEISINGKYLYTNFKEGTILITYNGYEEDDEGFVIIPETSENHIIKYLRAYVSKEIIKRMFINSDNTTNEQMLYQLFDAEANLYFRKTLGEIKMGKVLNTLEHYGRNLLKRIEVYNYGEYSTNSNDRVGFLVV